MKKRMEQLSALADLMQERELAALSELARKRAAIRAELQHRLEARRSAMISAALDPAHLSGAAKPWFRLEAATLKDLAAQEARIAADAESQSVKARQALGRAQALGKLAARRPRS